MLDVKFRASATTLGSWLVLLISIFFVLLPARFAGGLTGLFIFFFFTPFQNPNYPGRCS
jgi:hypothetical protein